MKLYSAKEDKIVQTWQFNGDVLFIDTETTGLSNLTDSVFMISFSDRDGNAYALDLRESDVETKHVVEQLRAICSDNNIEKIGHNIKFDIHFLERMNFKFRNFNDTMILARLVNNRLMTYRLKDLAVNLLDKKITEKNNLDNYFKKAQTKATIGGLFGDVAHHKAFNSVPFEIISKYAAADVILTRDLFEYLAAQIHEQGLCQIVKLEKDVLQKIVAIENRGFAVDVDFIRAEKINVEKELAALEKEIKHEVGDFDILSNNDVADVLFVRLGLVSNRYTDTGKPKVDKFTLADLERQHPIAGKIKAYRDRHQYLGAFINSLLTRNVDGIIYAEFNQLNAKTGRMSSSNPNLQNLPSRDETKSVIRKAFLPRQGYFLFSFDYSQIEYRLFAHYVNNAFLTAAYKNDHDFHAETGKLLGISRDDGKKMNFGLIYGMGKAALARSLGVSEDVAAKFIAEYFGRFPEARDLKYKVSDVIEQRGYIKTIFNRHSRVPKEEAYKGLNTLIQGSAADVFKLAVSRVGDYIVDKDIHIINMVHDEIILEIKFEDFSHVREIQKIMSSVVELRVPIKVGIEFGLNWFDMVDFSEYENAKDKVTFIETLKQKPRPKGDNALCRVI